MTRICKKTSLWCKAILTGLTTGLLTPGLMSSAFAEITPDGTTNTNVKINGNNLEILDGLNQGSNLFHSFNNFSVNNGQAAIFDLKNTPDITTIFSRVTGGNISHIDGVIRTLNSNNPVSLFLMNPNGIVFGPNARLDISGSFVGTTASSIKFVEGTEFSAVNTKPLLTMSVPIGLQMGQNPGEISVQGSGHGLISNLLSPIDRTRNPIGLKVQKDKTLMLMGGAVNFAGGMMTTNGGGHLEVGSVSEGQVKLKSSGTGWVGDYSSVKQFNDINLVNQSLLDASGNNGSIQLQGRNINLSDGSAILLQNWGLGSSGGITLQATESLHLSGNVTDGSVGSAIAMENVGMGQIGDITIAAKQLSVADGGRIFTGIYTPGSGGNITANITDSIFINGFAPTNPSNNSWLGTYTFSPINAGNITISSGNVKLLGGAIISITAGIGQSGTLQLNAKDLIEIVGTKSLSLASSSIATAAVGLGNANSIDVNTSRLVLRDGGFLGSTTLNQGASGSVTLNATNFIEVSGRLPNSIMPSRISSTADIIDPYIQAAYGLPPLPSGDAGTLTINTPSLWVTDGAFVSVKNDGPGQAGDLQINANLLFLDKQGSISASTASGNGGNISLYLQDYLLMRHNSFISATAAGNGNGGNLLINSPVIVGLENSDVIANAVQGRGGNIQISTQGIIGLEFRNTLTPKTDLTNDITASSQFNVNGTVQINNVGVDPNSGLVELPVNVSDSSQQIVSGCSNSNGSSFVAIGRGGIPQNPTQEMRSDRPWSDVRDLTAFSKTKPAQAQIPKSPETLVQATGWRRNADGKVELFVTQITNVQTSMQASLTCAAISQN